MPGEITTGGSPQDNKLILSVAKLNYKLNQQKPKLQNFETDSDSFQRCTCANIEVNGGICNGGCAS